jgi:hypothetical protein
MLDVLIGLLASLLLAGSQVPFLEMFVLSQASLVLFMVWAALGNSPAAPHRRL